MVLPLSRYRLEASAALLCKCSQNAPTQASYSPLARAPHLNPCWIHSRLATSGGLTVFRPSAEAGQTTSGAIEPCTLRA